METTRVDAVLQRYAAANGRRWKSALSMAWMRGNYAGTPYEDISLLQRIRNGKGPSWLRRYRLPS